MSIPANDAFTLNAYSHSATRRHGSTTMSGTRRALTRSPSPKIAFSAALQSTDGSKPTRRKLPHRSPPNGALSDSSQNGILEGVDEDSSAGDIHDRADVPTEAQHRNVGKGRAGIETIDWEAPRKLLHASIGNVPAPVLSVHELTSALFPKDSLSSPFIPLTHRFAPLSWSFRSP